MEMILMYCSRMRMILIAKKVSFISWRSAQSNKNDKTVHLTMYLKPTNSLAFWNMRSQGPSSPKRPAGA